MNLGLRRTPPEPEPMEPDLESLSLLCLLQHPFSEMFLSPATHSLKSELSPTSYQQYHHDPNFNAGHFCKIQLFVFLFVGLPLLQSPHPKTVQMSLFSVTNLYIAFSLLILTVNLLSGSSYFCTDLLNFQPSLQPPSLLLLKNIQQSIRQSFVLICCVATPVFQSIIT